MEETSTVICKNAACKKEYSTQFEKCPFCGASKPEGRHHPLQNEQIICQKCGKKYRNNNDGHCPFCGEKVPEWIENQVVILPLPFTTTDGYYRKDYIELGVASGGIVLSKNFISDAFAGLKSIVGGEIKTYTNMLENARTEAIGRMSRQAEELGADAIIGVRFSTSAIIAEAAEIMCYGTAIKIK